MTDIIHGTIATLGFFSLGWEVAGFIMALVTVAIFYWTARIIAEQTEEDE